MSSEGAFVTEYPRTPFILLAEQVTANIIGSMVEFDWEYKNSGVESTIKGELRQIAHNSRNTVLILGGGGGDVEEFEVDHMTKVSVIEQ